MSITTGTIIYITIFKTCSIGTRCTVLSIAHISNYIISNVTHVGKVIRHTQNKDLSRGKVRPPTNTIPYHRNGIIFRSYKMRDSLLLH